jgi:hypothetical protein
MFLLLKFLDQPTHDVVLFAHHPLESGEQLIGFKQVFYNSLLAAEVVVAVFDARKFLALVVDGLSQLDQVLCGVLALNLHDKVLKFLNSLNQLLCIEHSNSPRVLRFLCREQNTAVRQDFLVLRDQVV